MKWGIIKEGVFWAALFAFSLPIALSLYYAIGSYSATFFVVMFVVVVVYYIHYMWSDSHITKERTREIVRYYENKDKENIEKVLSLAEVVNSFFGSGATQKIRSNIFLKSDSFDGYEIFAHYNMNNCPDLKVRIPVNKGATGEAWLSKAPVWADREQIFEGVHRIPPEERNKLEAGIGWVCSHPIVKNNETVAVINIDGNSEIADQSMKDRINKTAHSITNVLDSYDLCVLKRVNEAPNK